MLEAMSSPRVSVLMPLYNAQAHLLDSVSSLTAQTFGDFEIIAVNDGSTDATGQLLDDFARSEPRCRVIHTTNGGIVSALNTAASHATGIYFARLDGDDLARADRFAEQVAFLDQKQDCVCVGSLYRTIDENGNVVREQKPFGHFRQTDLDTFPPFVASPPHPSIMMRRSAFEKIGGYRAAFPHAEDHDLFLRLARLGTVDLIQKHLLDYRVHQGSLSGRNLGNQVDSALRAVLSALVVHRGGIDPTPDLPASGRQDYYRALNDPAYAAIFDLYGDLALAHGMAGRGLRAQAARGMGYLAFRLLVAFPRYVGNPYYRSLVKALARSTARLALRRM